MYEPLAPCLSCRRHVRSVEPTCPFCGVARAPTTQVEADAPVRMSRAAAYAIAASFALTGCQTTEPTTNITNDPVVAKPTTTPTTTATPTPDAGLVDDHGGMVAKYGAPPPPPHTAPAPMYGLPPPRHE